MLMSRTELENLERFEASEARRSARSLQDVLESTFEAKEARSNPERELPFKELSREEAKALILDQLRRFFVWEGKTGDEADEVYDQAESYFKKSNQGFDLGEVAQSLTSLESAAKFKGIYNALLTHLHMDPKNSTFIPEDAVNQFAEAIYPIILRDRISNFIDTLLSVPFEKYAGKGVSDQRKAYRHFAGQAIKQYSQLQEILAQHRRQFERTVVESVRYNHYDWFDDTLRKGLLYLCGRFLTLDVTSANAHFLQIVTSYPQPLSTLLEITADYWSRFKSFEEVIAFTTDPAKEAQRVVVDKTLTLISSKFVGSGTSDFGKWYIVAGFSGFKRLVPLVEEAVFGRDGGEKYAIQPKNQFSHGRAGILLESLALLQMPAKQFKGYSKKLKAKVRARVASLGRPETTLLFEGNIAQVLATAFQGEGNFRFSQDLTALVNSVSGTAGLFLSFAKELHQKAGGALAFDEELLRALNFSSVEYEDWRDLLEGWYEREVALCAAVLAVLPEKEYDEIANLKSRNFDYLQEKILNFVKNRPSLRGEALIEFYLAPREDVSERSYLSWCSALFDVFAEAEGASAWDPRSLDGYDADLLSKFGDDGGDYLKVFLEASDPTLNQREFHFSTSVCYEGGVYRDFWATNDLAQIIQLADAYRRLHLGVGGNVDKTLHPTWHEVLPAEGLYFVALPRFHPIWWIIGSVSIANCCMTPDSVGMTSSRSGFWGNRDRSFLVVHKPSSTIIGSIQAVGIRLGTEGPWELAFDGFEKRNSQGGDSPAQKQALEKYLTVKPFFEEPQVLEWMRENIPYLPEGTERGEAYSGYIDYSGTPEDFNPAALRNLEGGLVTISDVTEAYRDFAKRGSDVKYVGSNPPTMDQIWAYKPNLTGMTFENESFFEGQRFPPRTELRGTRFLNCSLKGASFADCFFEEVSFEECNLEGVDFTGAHLENVMFRECHLKNAVFDQTHLGAVEFINKEPRGAGLRGASFKDASFHFVDFSQALNVGEALHLDALPRYTLVTF